MTLVVVAYNQHNNTTLSLLQRVLVVALAGTPVSWWPLAHDATNPTCVVQGVVWLLYADYTPDFVLRCVVLHLYT